MKENKEKNRVAVVTVTYGNRWKFLSQVIDAVCADMNVTACVVVDNASENGADIDARAAEDSRIVILRQSRNIGSAGGFAAGIKHVQTLPCDFVLLLDDDNVPEKGFSKIFLEHAASLGEKAVALGNRNDLKANEQMFYATAPVDPEIPTTFFSVFAWKKIRRFASMLFSFGRTRALSEKNFKPVIEVESFAYGGTFLPINAARNALLPDEKLFSYGDDIEYSWGVRRAGFQIFLCHEPVVHDIDLTFQSDYLLDLFSPKTSDFKVFFRMRNMALISRKHSRNVFVLWLNVWAWFAGLCAYALCKLGPSRFFFHRAAFIAGAFRRGLMLDYSMPLSVKVPGAK